MGSPAAGAAEPVPERPPLGRGALITAAAVIALTAIVIANLGDVGAALGRLTPFDAIALAALHLLALVMRAIAWGICLDAAGSSVPARKLHATSAPRFLADTAVPTYLGAWVRVGLLRALMGRSAPTVGQMITADAVLLLVEAMITVVAVVVLTVAVGVPWWWPAVIGGLAAAGLATAVVLRRRYAGRPFVRTLDVLAHRRTLIALVALLMVVLVVQPVRFWIAINGVGIDADAIEAVLAFLGTSVIGALPVGPGPASVGATGAVFNSAELGAIAASGIVLAGTAFIAAATYVLAVTVTAGASARGAVLAVLRRRELPSSPAGTGQPR